MFLCIYKKNDKLFHNFQEKLSEPFKVVTEDFKHYSLTSKHRVEFFKLANWADFWKIKEQLEKYKLRIMVTCVRHPDKTDIGLNVFLLDNPVRSILLESQDKPNPEIEEGDCLPSLYEIWGYQDFLDAEKEFNFTSDIKDEIFNQLHN